MADLGTELARRVVSAVRTAFDLEIALADAVIRPSTRPGADYQCNAAMALAKRLGRPSREVGAAIVEALDADDLVHAPEVAGPGFVNLVLRDDWLAARLGDLGGDPRLGVAAVAEPARHVVDYGGPNVAKEMHVGHLRSAIIGDAIVRLLDFAGHEVIRRNHLGDWGTPFGMLIEHLLDSGRGAEGSIADLNGFYQEARKKFDAAVASDPDSDSDGFAQRARARVVALQGGDSETLALWRDLVAESQRHFEKVYSTLGVRLVAEDSYGESFYNPMLADTVTELTDKDLVRISDGALCAFPPGFTGRDDEPLPIIVRKTDGGYTYGTTDLAGLRYWTTERDAAEIVYVVGAPQRQHFAMVFAVASQAGWLDADHRATHVSFGSVLGDDGGMLRTRSGDSVKLIDLLGEAVERAAAVVASRAELDPAMQESVSRAVGIGAVKYADLSSDRDKDYVFSWPKMLAMEGNTSVYLQYANARIRSVLRRAEVDPDVGVVAPVALDEPAERALALALLRLPAAVSSALDGYAPHKLCGYLFDLASAFSTFYETCPIVAAPSDAVRASRLALATLTSRVLVLGLDLLGIEAPARL